MAPKSSGSKPKGTDRPPDPRGAPTTKPTTWAASKQSQPAKVDFTTVQPTQKAQESLKGKEKEGGEGAKAVESSEDEGEDEGSDKELKAAVALSRGDDAGVGEASFDDELALVSPAKPSTVGLPAGARLVLTRVLLHLQTTYRCLHWSSNLPRGSRTPLLELMQPWLR